LLVLRTVLTLPLPSVCGSVYGILGPSSFTPGCPSQCPHRHCGLVLQRLGRRFLSLGHVAPQAASTGVSGALLRYHRDQYVFLWTAEAGVGEALVPQGRRGEPELSFHCKALPRIHPLANRGDG